MAKKSDFEALTEEAVTFAANQICEAAKQAKQRRTDEKKASAMLWRKLKELADAQK